MKLFIIERSAATRDGRIVSMATTSTADAWVAAESGARMRRRGCHSRSIITRVILGVAVPALGVAVPTLGVAVHGLGVSAGRLGQRRKRVSTGVV